MLDLNNAEDFGVKEVKIFNNGDGGIAKNVSLRVDKKPEGDTSNQPDYKLYAVGANGEVNEGFYYSDDAEKFKRYQSQKLINLARGVMGNDYKFENFASPMEALDKIMLLVKQNSVDSPSATAADFSITLTCDHSLATRPERGSIICPTNPFVSNVVPKGAEVAIAASLRASAAPWSPFRLTCQPLPSGADPTAAISPVLISTL